MSLDRVWLMRPFFYKNDARVSLHERREQLKKVVFQEKLGSVFAKTERVATLAKRLSVEAGADPAVSLQGWTAM